MVVKYRKTERVGVSIYYVRSMQETAVGSNGRRETLCAVESYCKRFSYIYIFISALTRKKNRITRDFIHLCRIHMQFHREQKIECTWR